MPRSEHRKLSSFSRDELQQHLDFCAQMERGASGNRDRQTWREARIEAENELRKKTDNEPEA